MKATSKNFIIPMQHSNDDEPSTVNHPTDPTNQAMRKKSLSLEYITGTIERKKTKMDKKWQARFNFLITELCHDMNTTRGLNFLILFCCHLKLKTMKSKNMSPIT